jgi:hypothetical protein
MAEINKNDLISEDALKAPLILAENLMKVYETLVNIQNVSGSALKGLDSADTIKKVKTNSEELTAQEKQLLKVQEQLAVALAKNNQEYADYQRAIKEVNQATKERVGLGEKDSLTINKQNASIKELEAALNKNRHAYSQLRTEEQRSSKSGQELLKVIQQQDKDFKELRQSMGQNQDSVGDYNMVVRELRKEMKAAQGEMALLAETTGQGSEQYQAAAKRAGEIADRLADAKDEAKAFQGDTAIENLGTRFDLLGQKVTNLDFRGAQLQITQITQLSRQMTFKEAIGGLGGAGKAFGQLGKAILTNPLFIIAAVIIGLGVAIYKLRDSIRPLTIAFDAVGEAIDWVVQKLKDFSDWLGISSFESDKQTAKIIDNSKKQLDAIGKRYDNAIKLAEAEGKATIDLERMKLREIQNTATKGILALEKKQKRGSKLTEEEIKTLAELNAAYQNAGFELQLINAKMVTDWKKTSEERLKLEKDAQFELRKLRLNNAIKTEQDIINNTDKSYEERKQAAIKAEQLQNKLINLELDKALKDADGIRSKELIAYKNAQIAKAESAKQLNDTLTKLNKEYTESFAKVQDDIANNENNTYQQRIDAARIAGELREQTEQQIADRIIAIQKSVVDRERAIQQERRTQLQTEFNNELALLDEQYSQGLLSTAQYRREREALENKSRNKVTEQEIKQMEELKTLMSSFGQSTIEIDKAISDARLAIASESAKEKIAYEERYRQTVEQIANEVMASAAFFMQAETQREIERLEGKLAREEEAKNRSIALVGDDAQAKAFIEAEYARKQEQIQKQIAAQKRKQAIFDKASNAAEVIANTATGVVKAVSASPLTFGLPWSAFVAATGALQLARVLATPIPQFATGVKNFEGGAAIVGEKGSEFVRSGNQYFLTPDVATLVNLPKGSDVIPHEESMRMLAMSALVSNDRNGGSQNKLEEVFMQVGNNIVKAISSTQDVWDDDGYRRYTRSVNGRVNRLDKRYSLK